MAKITATYLMNEIKKLDKRRDYNYISSRTKTLIRIDRIDEDRGGIIYITRWNPTQRTENTYETGKKQTISKELQWRVANAIVEGEPFNIDRIVGASYNTRSAYETLLALTPHFYSCNPGRINDIGGKTTVESGHKHLIYFADKEHPIGEIEKVEIDEPIVEIPQKAVRYEALKLPQSYIDTQLETIDTDLQGLRRHAQIQIALYQIGKRMGFKTWIAQNDHSIEYAGKKIIEHEAIITDLNDTIIREYGDAAYKARLVDALWFDDNNRIPAIMEVEHTTGVTTGLDRMMTLYREISGINTTYVIVAPDEDRDRVLRECKKPHYHKLQAKFFPYSAVEELLYLSTHRTFKFDEYESGKQAFIEGFMEEIETK